MSFTTIVVVLTVLFGQIAAEFTAHFNNFLTTRYGEEMQKTLERRDLGSGMYGSFGGKVQDTDKITHRVCFSANFRLPKVYFEKF